MDLQKLVDAISRSASQERAKYHLTVGELIDALEKAYQEMLVQSDRGGGVGDPGSYRGYYQDVALEPLEELRTAGVLLKELNAALGTTFTGYKGGDYLCTRQKPLWISPWGSASGIAIMGERIESGKFILETEYVD